jgi:hypothetical protein
MEKKEKGTGFAYAVKLGRSQNHHVFGTGMMVQELGSVEYNVWQYLIHTNL